MCVCKWMLKTNEESVEIRLMVNGIERLKSMENMDWMETSMVFPLFFFFYHTSHHLNLQYPSCLLVFASCTNSTISPTTLLLHPLPLFFGFGSICAGRFLNGNRNGQAKKKFREE